MIVGCFYCGEKIERQGAERKWQCFKCRQQTNRARTKARYIPAQGEAKTKGRKKRIKEDKRYLFFIEAEARMILREEARKERLLSSQQTLQNAIIAE